MISAHEELEAVMKREIQVLRELLSSIHLEQEALLENDAERVKGIIYEREAIADELERGRTRRRDLILAAGRNLGFEATEDRQMLRLLQEYLGEETCCLMNLRDQMLALLDKIENQHARNRYFLEKKIQRTRQLMERLKPENPNQTYGCEGTVVKTKVKTKVTLLNREV